MNECLSKVVKSTQFAPRRNHRRACTCAATSSTFTMDSLDNPIPKKKKKSSAAIKAITSDDDPVDRDDADDNDADDKDAVKGKVWSFAQEGNNPQYD
jgi:hypothetical protein